jgi:hypothetical protein
MGCVLPGAIVLLGPRPLQDIVDLPLLHFLPARGPLSHHLHGMRMHSQSMPTPFCSQHKGMGPLAVKSEKEGYAHLKFPFLSGALGPGPGIGATAWPWCFDDAAGAVSALYVDRRHQLVALAYHLAC